MRTRDLERIAKSLVVVGDHAAEAKKYLAIVKDEREVKRLLAGSTDPNDKWAIRAMRDKRLEIAERIELIAASYSLVRYRATVARGALVAALSHPRVQGRDSVVVAYRNGSLALNGYRVPCKKGERGGVQVFRREELERIAACSAEWVQFVSLADRTVVALLNRREVRVASWSITHSEIGSDGV